MGAQLLPHVGALDTDTWPAKISLAGKDAKDRRSLALPISPSPRNRCKHPSEAADKNLSTLLFVTSLSAFC